ncbi:MAG: hypothetical protein LBN26_10395 [Christensenellaceae bacterium]|jgi:hypothetical protein|nr:hypothetical protein [Christensenellaceae bacterium]
MMYEGMYEANFRKGKRQLYGWMVFALLALLLVVLFFVTEIAHLYPFAVPVGTEEELIRNRGWRGVKIGPTDFYDYTDYYYYETNEDKPKYYFYYVSLDDGIAVIVRDTRKLWEQNWPAVTFEGEAVWDEDRETWLNFFDTEYEYTKDDWTAQELENMLSYYALDATGDSHEKARFFGVVIGIWFIIAFFISRGGRKRMDKNREALELIGDVDALDAAFTEEYQAGQDCARFGKLHVTPHFLFNALAGSALLMPISEIVWVYKHVTTTKMYGVVSTGKTYTIEICFRNGHKESVALALKQSDALLELLYDRVGQTAVFGYTEGYAALWSNGAGAAEFVQNSGALVNQPPQSDGQEAE